MQGPIGASTTGGFDCLALAVTSHFPPLLQSVGIRQPCKQLCINWHSAQTAYTANQKTMPPIPASQPFLI